MSEQLIGDLLSVGGKVQEERDRLIVQLAESERLRQDAFRACEIHRQEHEKLRLERDEWKAGAEYQQQQVTQLRKRVEHLEASLEQEQGVSKTLLQQLADADAQIRQFEQINDTRDELQYQNKALQQQVTELQAQLEAVREIAENNYAQLQQARAVSEHFSRQIADLQLKLESEQQQVDKLDAQLAAAVTPTHQPDGSTAERLEAVRRLIGEIRGWYACIEYFDEIKWAEAWEQVGALLGHLQREVG